MHCTNCGTLLESGARFCGGCGVPVEAPNALPAPSVTPTPTPPQPLPRPSVYAPATSAPQPVSASRRGAVYAFAGMAAAVGVAVVYTRNTKVPFWVPSTPTPVPTATPKRLSVDATGSGEYRTISSAIAAARPQDTIVIRPGTYKETLRLSQYVKIVGEGGRSKVIIEGENGNPAIIIFSGKSEISGVSIKYAGTEKTDSAIGAISIRGGTPLIEDCDLTSSAGSAIFIIGNSSIPVIRNCSIHNCRDYGVYFYEAGKGIVEGCQLYGNLSSGIVISEEVNPEIRDCDIRDMNEFGLIVKKQSKGIVEKTTISSCRLAGVAVSDGGNPDVRDCQIRNHSQGGVFVLDQGLGTFQNCDISGNTYAGIEVKTGGNPTVRNCQIRNGKSSGIYVHNLGQGVFTGNTLTGNAAGAWNISYDAGRVTRTGNFPNS